MDPFPRQTRDDAVALLDEDVWDVPDGLTREDCADFGVDARSETRESDQ